MSSWAESIFIGIIGCLVLLLWSPPFWQVVALELGLITLLMIRDIFIEGGY